MSKPTDVFADLQARLDIAEGLLVTLCGGLEADGVPLPPELLDWWISYQKENAPRIQLIN